ncbi:hypothetical protein M885DRAFT_589441 [Pelagophyceae sp. CCMP2097]|nr:hypothetical protein M885DRAFT_589441 [Pelagophyceae sp. CCMP2097]|mmetsp:Transcript_23451/g.81327  ORF Transcript_23451/g.81327 Transcript_23451/m.81327 type:complete len:540 (-) Transcript_23451:168-1787(-)
MLLLFETAAGHALFELQGAAKLKKVDAADLYTHFSTQEQCTSNLKLRAFQSFKDTAEAVAAATDAVESKLGKPLKKFLEKHVAKKAAGIELGVADPKLGALIKEKLGIPIAHGSFVNEAMRGARAAASGAYAAAGSSQEDVETALDGVASRLEVKAMQLGLSHSLSRYKLKFSPDKVDTMVVQAVGLLDDLDKEVNTYAMRVREWYGWHFPEMAKIVNDNLMYAKIVLAIGGFRSGARDKHDALTEILDDEAKATTLRETAEISMGTEVDEADMKHIAALAEEVVELTLYRAELSEYLKNRMQAIAPNLTVLVGELVGARLVQHAGSIMNLAKHPASTVQILGAEKALFRALKTKHDTPKYGLIYHASLIGQAAPKNKGKISRVLAAKCALAIRVDALGEEEGATIGYEARAKVEARLRQLEGGGAYVNPSATPKKLAEIVADAGSKAAPAYNAASDVADLEKAAKKSDKKKKRAAEAAAEEAADEAPKKKKKKASAEEEPAAEVSEKKKKKKKKDAVEEEAPAETSEKKKKKAKKSVE